MKRLFCFLLCGILLLGLFACAAQKEDFINPISFYYLRVQLPGQLHHGAVDSVISPEVREGKGIIKDIKMLLDYYMAGPLSDNYASPFPSDTTLIDWHMEGKTLCVVLSDQAATLSGVDLTLACACMTKTFLGLRDLDAVRIQAETLSLDGKPYITMDDKSLLLLDNSMTTTEPD